MCGRPLADNASPVAAGRHQLVPCASVRAAAAADELQPLPVWLVQLRDTGRLLPGSPSLCQARGSTGTAQKPLGCLSHASSAALLHNPAQPHPAACAGSIPARSSRIHRAHTSSSHCTGTKSSSKFPAGAGQLRAACAQGTGCLHRLPRAPLGQQKLRQKPWELPS